ncbi:acyltransferase [Dokdonella sp.]|uniref:acyltransferase n=1 Tax=Dokdonella sp. TaxID=2291710 RepID=UPI001B008650|nr:acyltransferase [Dokdonella sp.]MBO9664092.1 acyltransferase [Dokdonella sp.]
MRALPVFLRVTLAAVLIAASTVLHALPLLAVALIKVALPFRAVRRICDPWLTGLAESWIGVNSRLIAGFTRTRFVVVDEAATLQYDGHYLVLANHQSWVDIPVLQKVFNRRIPLLRFFLKSELFWIPVLGLAWWALDFPFMRRYTREQIERRPELAGRDIAATRRACAKFRAIPVAVMNFVEGTRYTPAKHAAQSSPYRHLLKPKSGGVAFVIEAMGDGLQGILDVTVVYPDRRPTLLDLFADRVGEVCIDVCERPIPREFVDGDYQNDDAFRERFQAWMNALWAEKDATYARLLAASGATAAATSAATKPMNP